jgi:fumarate reductase flavoprotein subunit
VVEGISQQEVKKAWALIDSENPAAEMTENSAMTEYKWKADTIEELADMIGVPSDNLVATIDAYNAAYDAGEDAEFETAHDNMLPVRMAPFYAVVCNPIAIGSLAGVKVNENCEVLVNDEPVPNLYACGEMVFGGNICTVYLGALSNATAFYTGRIAAAQAKAQL